MINIKPVLIIIHFNVQFRYLLYVQQLFFFFFLNVGVTYFYHLCFRDLIKQFTRCYTSVEWGFIRKRSGATNLISVHCVERNKRHLLAVPTWQSNVDIDKNYSHGVDKDPM